MPSFLSGKHLGLEWQGSRTGGVSKLPVFPEWLDLPLNSPMAVHKQMGCSASQPTCLLLPGELQEGRDCLFLMGVT